MEDRPLRQDHRQGVDRHLSCREREGEGDLTRAPSAAAPTPPPPPLPLDPLPHPRPDEGVAPVCLRGLPRLHPDVFYIGATITGSIINKFESGYIVMVRIGEKKIFGVLYHVDKCVTEQSGVASVQDHIPSINFEPIERNAKIDSSKQISDGQSTRSIKRDVDMPLGARSSYQIFIKEELCRVKKQKLDLDNKGIWKMVLNSWRCLPKDDRLVQTPNLLLLDEPLAGLASSLSALAPQDVERVPKDLNCLRFVECMSAASARSKSMRSEVGRQILTHCIEKPAVNTVVAGILHDVIDDTFETLHRIKEEFGRDVASCCEGNVEGMFTKVLLLLKSKAEISQIDTGLYGHALRSV